MENYVSGMSNKKDIESNAMARRPVKQAYEDLGSTFGSKNAKKPQNWFGPRTTNAKATTSSRDSGKSSKPGSSGTTEASNRRKTSPVIDLNHDSDDEMDCLSSQLGDYDDPSSTQVPVGRSSPDTSWDVRATTTAKKRSAAKSPARKSYVDDDGTAHALDPALVAKSNALAGLKFKKNKPGDENSGSSQQTKSSSSSTSRSQSLKESEPLPEKKTTVPLPTRQLRVKESDPVPEKKTPVPLPTRIPRAPSDARSMGSSAPKRASPADIEADAPKSRPKPRPTYKGANGFKKSTEPTSSQSSTRRMLDMVDLDLDATPKPSGSQRRKELEKGKGKERARSRSRSRSQSRSRSRSPGRSKLPSKKKELQAYPAPSPLSTPVKNPKRALADFPDMSPLADSMSQETEKRITSKTKGKKPAKAAALMPFPMSPISVTSPQRASKSVPDRKGKGKAEETKEKPEKKTTRSRNRKIVESSDLEESDSDEGSDDQDNAAGKRVLVPRRKLAAFPMATQMLASIGSPGRPVSYSPPRSVKRSSEGGSGDEHSSKKSRRIRELQESPSRHPFEEGESISIDPCIDPKSLCPYCDMPLPSSPSPLLLRLLSTTRLKSNKDARPSNPLGRSAPLAVFATVCQRHRFESKILPEAERKGWPKHIDWNKLEGRISKMKSQLKALMMARHSDEDGPDSSDSDADPNDWEVLHTSGKRGGGSKAKSIFWDELSEEIKKKGMKSIQGVQGQFDSFEKAQPGYYGELGSVIIHQTLYNMFPPASIDATIVAPLTVNQFVQRVLVPEVALRLIMEDKNLKGESGMQKALGILRDSSAYGVAMFPEDTNDPTGKRPTKDDPGKLGVGDMIVMERARKRRKELEEEEEQQRVDEEQEKEAFKRKVKADLKERREEQARTAESMEVTVPAPKPRPKPRPIMKSSSRMDMSSTDPETRPNAYRSPSRSRSTRNGMDTDTDASTDDDIYLKRFSKAGSSSSPANEIRRSLSASETRNENIFDEVDDTPRRAPSLEVAAMHIDASDRRSMTKANGRTRTSSRAPASSPTRRFPASRPTSRASDRSCSESSSGVEIVGGTTGLSSQKTPVPRKKVRPTPASSSNMDTTEDTPRAPTPPLLKAQRRRALNQQTNKAEQSNPIRRKKYSLGAEDPVAAEYSWLLSDPSQS